MGETVAALRTFRDAYRKRRCLPAVDNSFKWKAVKGAKAKQAYAIALKSGAPFALVGIWEPWRNPDTEEWVRTLAIITTAANEFVSGVHDRMPVIISPDACDRWLSAIEPDPRDLLVAYPADLMTRWPISIRVNKLDNDDPAILEAAATQAWSVL